MGSAGNPKVPRMRSGDLALMRSGDLALMRSGDLALMRSGDLALMGRGLEVGTKYLPSI
jgi:hypothetical protein